MKKTNHWLCRPGNAAKNIKPVLFFSCSRDSGLYTRLDLFYFISDYHGWHTGCPVTPQPNRSVVSRKNAEKASGSDITLRNFCSPLSFYGIYIVAGLEARFHWSSVPQPVVAAGLVLSAVANLLMSWALLSNKYYEADTPMLKDAQPVVCSSGPYRFVRHPGYLFMSFWAVTVGMIFGWATGIVSAVIVLLLILRTYYEDQSLLASFPGYVRYAQQVKYRLIPFIW